MHPLVLLAEPEAAIVVLSSTTLKDWVYCEMAMNRSLGTAGIELSAFGVPSIWALARNPLLTEIPDGHIAAKAMGLVLSWHKSVPMYWIKTMSGNLAVHEYKATLSLETQFMATHDALDLAEALHRHLTRT